jgi:hypothetical protein
LKDIEAKIEAKIAQTRRSSFRIVSMHESIEGDHEMETGAVMGVDDRGDEDEENNSAALPR